MAQAYAEASESLVNWLETNATGLCRIVRKGSEIGRTSAGEPILVITIDSPLIDPDWMQVEVANDGGALRIKCWRDV